MEDLYNLYYEDLRGKILDAVRVTRGLLEAGTDGEIPGEYLLEEFQKNTENGVLETTPFNWGFILYTFAILEIVELQRKIEGLTDE